MKVFFTLYVGNSWNGNEIETPDETESFKNVKKIFILCRLILRLTHSLLRSDLKHIEYLNIIVKQVLNECASITDPDKCEFAYKHKTCRIAAGAKLGLVE